MGRAVEGTEYPASRKTGRDHQSPRRSRSGYRLLATLLCGLLLPTLAQAEFRLSDQEAELYYELAVAAGEELQAVGQTEIVGDVHSNGRAEILPGITLRGDLSVVDRLVLRGAEVEGTVTEGAAPRTLPELAEETALRELADRVLEGDVTFDENLTLEEILFVDGTVRIRGELGGEGTLIATGDIRLDTVRGRKEFSIGEDDRVSLISLEDVRFGKERTFRGVVRAGRDVAVERSVTFEGVIVAERRVQIGKEVSLTFVDFDQVAPLVEPQAPPASSFLPTATPTVEVAYSDEFSGLRLDSVALLLDGVDVTAEAEVGAEGVTFTPVTPLADGPHTVAVSVTDHSDNTTEVSFGFTTDTVPPTVALLAPEVPPSGVFFNEVPPARVELADATSGVDPESFRIAVDGEAFTAACSTDGAEATCPFPELAEGAHTVVARVSDRAGNVAEASLAFTLIFDLEPPVITVASPADGAVVNQETLPVTGTVTDKTEVASFTVNGEPVALAGGSFTTTVALVPGPNEIVLEAADIVGNAGSRVLTVTLAGDTTPPTVRITSPRDGVFLTEPRPPVDISFRDDDSGVVPESLELALDGEPIAATCDLGRLGARCTPEEALPERSLELSARVADEAGNVGVAAIDVTVDIEGLDVTLTSPEDGLLTRDGELTVTGTTSVEVEAVEVNGVPAEVTGLTFSATVPLREGVNMVVALGRKANDFTASDTLEVTRDLTAPRVRIDSPRDGFVAVGPEVPVTGLVNDIVGGGVVPQVTVNGVEVPVEGGSFMLHALELVPGPNVIEAVATDAVGNQGSHEITVTFEPPAGVRLGLASGNGQRGVVRQTLPEPLVAEVTDALGNPVAGRLVRFEVSRNSGTLRTGPGTEPQRVVQVPTDGAGRAGVLLTLGDTAGEGNNRVRVTAVGVAGEVEFCASGTPEAPDKVLMVSGDNQRGLAGRPLPEPLEALVVDADGNPLGGVPVTFRVVEGSGNLDGQGSLTRLTDADGLVRAVLKLGADPGINNNRVTATLDGVDGLPATYVASGLAPGDPAETRLSGVVLDNGHTPIPEAEVHIGDTDLVTTTDSRGQFTLEGVPVGAVHLEIDPSESPRPETFPPLAFETVTVAGQNNTIGQPILIPAVDAVNSKLVGGAEDVTLQMEGVPGLTLTVFANSTTFPDGSRTGRVSISQVHLDKVPMPPPSGTIFMPPAWTIQPSGVRFDPPARITIPNDGLAPGRVIDIFQFDHALNEFINVGKGEVSGDGLLITSLDGFGISRAGWGGCGQPQPPPTCPSSCDDGNDCTVDFCEDGSCRHEPLFTDCDDGNECTTGDRCQEGQCEGDPAPEGTPCGGSNDEESCTFDECDGEGNCRTGEAKPDGTPCDDMTFCTMPDECMGGSCEGEEVEDMECDPIDIMEDIDVGPYDLLLITIPKLVVMYDIQGTAKTSCCEEREIKQAYMASASGPFNGELSELEIPIPGAGNIAKVIDKLLCKKVVERFTKSFKCKVGVEISASGIMTSGSLTVEDDECEDQTLWDGGGSLTVNDLKISGGVEVTKKATDDDDGFTVNGEISGTDTVTGTIEAAERNLLLTLMESGATVEATVTVPLPIVGEQTFTVDHTFDTQGEFGPFTFGTPGIPRSCQ